MVETPLPDDASVQDITLKLGCWDESTGTPATASYTDQYNEYNYLELTNLRMEPVDAGNEWATYKLIGTIAEDGSHRIFFFTDPTGESGQLQLLVLSPDYSQTWFDSGIRSWGDAVDPTDASDASDPSDPSDSTDASDGSDPSDCTEATVETPLPDDAAVQDITATGLDAVKIPADGAYTDQYNNYEWQEFTSCDGRG